MSDLIEKLIVIEKKAKEFGFDWENHNQIIDQVISECNEVNAEIISGNHKALQEELGDLIIATMALAFYLNCDIKECMKLAIDKFDIRLNKTIEIANSKGVSNFHGLSTEEMLKYWGLAKEVLK